LLDVLFEKQDDDDFKFLFAKCCRKVDDDDDDEDDGDVGNATCTAGVGTTVAVRFALISDSTKFRICKHSSLDDSLRFCSAIAIKSCKTALYVSGLID
jgi:hypothetical protein